MDFAEQRDLILSVLTDQAQEESKIAKLCGLPVSSVRATLLPMVERGLIREYGFRPTKYSKALLACDFAREEWRGNKTPYMRPGSEPKPVSTISFSPSWKGVKHDDY
jgi:hypothetical protein